MELHIIQQVLPNVVSANHGKLITFYDAQGNEVDVDLSKFTKDENGKEYEYYLSEMVDGMYVADTDKLNAQATADATTKSKSDRQIAVDALVITITNGKQFNGDKDSIADLKNALDTAREYAEMYPTADALTETSWKLYDDSVATVTFAEIQEAYIRGNLQYQQTFISFG